MSDEVRAERALKKKMGVIQDMLSDCGFVRKEVTGTVQKDSTVFFERIDDLPIVISIWITASADLELINIALVSSYHIRHKFIPEIVMQIHTRQQKDCMGTLVVDFSTGQVCWRYDLPWRLEGFSGTAVAKVVVQMVRVGIDMLVDFLDDLTDELNDEEAATLPAAHLMKRT